jgi:hypothetical protein
MGAKHIEWESKGFAAIPQMRVALDGGVMVYRCFDGARSKEWGTGYFSLEKPRSVVDAELRFNIVEWGNLIRFVSTFRIRPGFHYHSGPIAHGSRDLSRPATQVYIEPPLAIKLDLVESRELLKHDALVIANQDPGMGRSS